MGERPEGRVSFIPHFGSWSLWWAYSVMSWLNAFSKLNYSLRGLHRVEKSDVAEWISSECGK
jgi:hypothetical protein